MKGNSKLYFNYGAMGSAKTVQAVVSDFNYKEHGFKTLLLKPSIDDRWDRTTEIVSRTGLSAPCISVGESDSILSIFVANPTDVVIVDEAQFLTPTQVEELRYIVDNYSIPVVCYGLRTDFRGRLFSGAQRLFELADTFNEIKSLCSCGKKATMSARFKDGKIVTDGPVISIGDNSCYKAMCHKCYAAEIAKAVVSDGTVYLAEKEEDKRWNALLKELDRLV